MAIEHADPQDITSKVILKAQDIEDKIRGLIRYIGDDPDREGLVETPKRIRQMWETIFGGYHQEDPATFLGKTFELKEESGEMILLKNIEFYSTCEHHMLPFFGKVSIGYVPVHRVVGVSKLARVVESYARRLQIQERMTTQIANTIWTALHPLGVAVLVEAQHLCMIARGVEKQHSVMVTSAMYGLYRYNDAARSEFLSIIQK